jgi:hypothetical protein
MDGKEWRERDERRAAGSSVFTGGLLGWGIDYLGLVSP